VNGRRTAVGLWATLCLGGLAATSALEPGPADDGGPEPEDTGNTARTAVVDCERIADGIAADRAAAEAEYRCREGGTFAFDVAVPEECADEPAARGLP
jgi:hypothetical protein